MITVALTWAEVNLAVQIGTARRIDSRQSRLTNAHGFGGQASWDTDIEGAGAELAFAKWAGWYWDAGVRTFKQPDVGLIQVRSTKLSAGRLILRPNDPRHEVYVLVTGEMPTLTLRGWLYGWEAMRPEFVAAPNGQPPCWMVPQPDLHPMPQLRTHAMREQTGLVAHL